MKVRTFDQHKIGNGKAGRMAALILIGAGLSVGIVGCGGTDSDFPGSQTPHSGPSNPTGKVQEDTLFGPNGLTLGLFGSGSSENTTGSPAIGVNSFLWRASLDTISFMPLQSADPFGGVIITDWYSNPKAPDERFKVTVYILDKRLRADGVKVSAFRQVKNAAGQWQDAAVDPALAPNLENAILARARQLRINATAASDD